MPAGLVGAFNTLKVKSIRQMEFMVAGGVSTIGPPAGVKVTWPVAGSMIEMLKIWPAHAVPASPTAVGLSWNTPGSAEAGGQSPAPTKLVVPQEGTRFRLLMVTLPALSGGVEVLATWIDAGRPV